MQIHVKFNGLLKAFSCGNCGRDVQSSQAYFPKFNWNNMTDVTLLLVVTDVTKMYVFIKMCFFFAKNKKNVLRNAY